MKIKRINPFKDFEPVTIQITFENADEITSFYCIMNYQPICDFLEKNGFDAGKVRDLVRPESNRGGRGNKFDELVSLLKEK